MVDWMKLIKRFHNYVSWQEKPTTSLESIESYNMLAVRLVNDLEPTQTGRGVMVAAVDDDQVAIEAITELAWCLADDLGYSVLLIDGTLGMGILTQSLGAEKNTGIAELIESADLGPDALKSAVASTRHPSIQILSQGLRKDKLKTVRAEDLEKIIDNSRSIYDYVLVLSSIMDAPSRSVAFGSHLDAALLVAVDGVSMINDIQSGQRILNECGLDQVALVLLMPQKLGSAPTLRKTL
jgi:Mrp family chromosome partitioning ATPase